jgi:hypothetical protein
MLDTWKSTNQLKTETNDQFAKRMSDTGLPNDSWTLWKILRWFGYKLTGGRTYLLTPVGLYSLMSFSSVCTRDKDATPTLTDFDVMPVIKGNSELPS